MDEKNEAAPQQAGHYPKRHGRNLVMLLAGAVLAVGGFLGFQAIAESNAYQHMRMVAFDGGWHGGGWHGGGWRRGEHKPLHEMSDAEIEDRINRMVRHVSIEIDGTPEQEQQIIAIMRTAAKEMRPLREQMQATRLELQALLTAETVDRAALEALRASRLAEAYRISKTLVGAVADVAETLTPEQHETLQALIRERRERGHHRGAWGRDG